jgi:hypothetical protein
MKDSEMNEMRWNSELFDRLAAYGSDLPRWPAELQGSARAALLKAPDFRRRWEAERRVDAAIVAMRSSLDRELARSGAVARLHDRVLERKAAAPFAGLRWQRVAAAVLIAGMLGGLTDLLLPERAAQQPDAYFDPAYVAEAGGG